MPNRVEHQEPTEIERYPDHEGQVIIRTRYATIQRHKKTGFNSRTFRSPHILGPDHCTGEGLEVMNEHLEDNQFTVYYPGSGETEFYEVRNDE